MGRWGRELVLPFAMDTNRHCESFGLRSPLRRWHLEPRVYPGPDFEEMMAWSRWSALGVDDWLETWKVERSRSGYLGGSGSFFTL